MTTQPDAKTIHVEYDLPHPPAKVWRALTDPALLGAWLMKNDFRPVVGHRFTFRAPPMQDWDGTVDCEVLEVQEPERLSYSWRGGPASSRIDTTVTWTLAPGAAGGTHLVLDHAGFLPAHAFAFEGLARGWRGKVAERITEVLSSAA